MYRNARILDLPKSGEVDCQYCGRQDGSVVAAHSNRGRHGKGLGIKAHDCFVAYLCNACHTYVDADPKASGVMRHALWRIAHKRSFPLFEHLLDAAGKQLLLEDIL